jgi:hypothetical protein
VTTLGNYGQNLVSSGDLVTLSDGTIYATAIDQTCVANSPSPCADLLVGLDPTTYSANLVGSIEDASGNPFQGIWGLGYWAGVLYGFDSTGDVLTIDPITGQATLVSGGDGGVPWYGAGTTPLAPTVP